MKKLDYIHALESRGIYKEYKYDQESDSQEDDGEKSDGQEQE